MVSLVAEDTVQGWTRSYCCAGLLNFLNVLLAVEVAGSTAADPAEDV